MSSHAYTFASQLSLYFRLEPCLVLSLEIGQGCARLPHHCMTAQHSAGVPGLHFPCMPGCVQAEGAHGNPYGCYALYCVLCISNPG